MLSEISRKKKQTGEPGLLDFSDPNLFIISVHLFLLGVGGWYLGELCLDSLKVICWGETYIVIMPKDEEWQHCRGKAEHTAVALWFAKFYISGYLFYCLFEGCMFYLFF